MFPWLIRQSRDKMNFASGSCLTARACETRLTHSLISPQWRCKTRGEDSTWSTMNAVALHPRKLIHPSLDLFPSSDSKISQKYLSLIFCGFGSCGPGLSGNRTLLFLPIPLPGACGKDACCGGQRYVHQRNMTSFYLPGSSMICASQDRTSAVRNARVLVWVHYRSTSQSANATP
jgi:hypothetical protein